jgi:phosphoribosylamine---glycine ligase
MNILITGSGGREHALAWKIKQSKKIDALYVAPGNAGTAQFAKNLPIDVNDFDNLAYACIENRIDILLVGPEAPLVEGIADFFSNTPSLRHIAVIGPNAAAARLEGSKAFAKSFMSKYQIPTAGSLTVTSETLQNGIDFLKQLQAPYVLKADGLAAGKGVLIINDIKEAEKELESMLKGKFGSASAQVVIETFLEGIELSAFVLTDGKNYKLLPSAKDYKRIGEGDTGPNTGGMGAVSPVVFADSTFMEKVESQVIVPTIKGLQAEGIPYKGFIFFGLMNVNGEPYVIEYNVRLGDPEAECILPRISSDFVDLLEGVALENLDTKKITIDDRFAVTVVLVSGGYPGNYKKNLPITGFAETKNCIVFHAGTGIDVENETIKTVGGRVIAVTSIDYSFDEARKKTYENAKKIQFEGKYYRKDIGLDLLNYRIV